MLQGTLINLLRSVASRKRIVDLKPLLVKTISVVELTRLGDVMIILPFLDRLGQLFPNARVRVFVGQDYASLLNSLETRFECIGIPNPSTFRGLALAVRYARDTPTDIAISMSPPRRNALVTLASRSHFKLGYLSHVNSLTPFLDSTRVESFGFVLPARVTYGRENIYQRSAKILLGLGVTPGPDEWRAKMKPEIYSAVRTRLVRDGRMPRRKHVLLHPFSGWEYRNWPLDNFLALAERINAQLGHDVVMSVGYKDLRRIRKLLEGRSPGTMILTSDLVETAVLTKDAQLVIGNDSGPLHLAAALNTRVVGLFGPAPSELTAPRASSNTYLYRKVDCSPCDQRICIRPDHSCMTLLGIDEVFVAVTRALQAPIISKSLTSDVQG